MGEHSSATTAIDFGTTTSFVAKRNGYGPAMVVPLSPGTPWLNSVAAVDGTSLVIGQEDGYAPDQLIRSVKRAITDRADTIAMGLDGEGEHVNADTVIAAIFAEIRKRAGHVLATGEVRLGCPAMWDGAQRKRLIRIAQSVGLSVTDATLIDEPVAAGLAWLADHDFTGGEPVAGRVLVFDMGGGTLDVAVLDVAGGTKEVSVLSSRGNPLAGDRLDEALSADLEAEAAARGVTIATLRQPAQARGLLARLAREAKVALSHQDLHTVVLPAVVFGRYCEIDYTRGQVEKAFHPLMTQAEQLVEEAVVEAQLKERFSDVPSFLPRAAASEIDYVLLIGGMSQIPYVRQRLAARFAKAAFVRQVDPVEAVAKGLTDNTGYEHINLHRPAFDFVLEWDGGAQRRLLYEAYTPIYREWQAASGRARLNYERRGRGMRLPRAGRGHLRVVSPSGRPVRLAVDGTSIDKLPVRFGAHELVFKIYTDGQLLLTDGSGKQTAMRVDRWPIINNRGTAELEVKKVKRKPMDAPPIWFVGPS